MATGPRCEMLMFSFKQQAGPQTVAYQGVLPFQIRLHETSDHSSHHQGRGSIVPGIEVSVNDLNTRIAGTNLG